MFYNAHIRSLIDYASTLWDSCPEDTLNNLISVQKRAAKLLNPLPDLTSNQKLISLNILPLKTQLRFNKGVFIYKILNNNCPNYMNDFLQCSVSSFGLNSKMLNLPRPRIDIFKHSLSFSGSQLWNFLPISLKLAPTYKLFKKQYQQYTFNSIEN